MKTRHRQRWVAHPTGQNTLLHKNFDDQLESSPSSYHPSVNANTLPPKGGSKADTAPCIS